jgi:hypothetical protein
MNFLSVPILRRWIILRNSYQDKNIFSGRELLTLKDFQPEILKLLEDVLENGSGLRIRVTGRSMAPFLKGGEILTIIQKPAFSLRTGDLILFKTMHDSGLVHRIIRKRKAEDGALWFLTKGDALTAFDQEIPESSILGRVCKIERESPPGKTISSDMGSIFHKCTNFCIAFFGLLKSRTYLFLRTLLQKRRKGEQAG